MILAIDFETNDKPASWTAPPEGTDNWPRIVQSGAILAHNDGRPVFQYESLIKPKNWSVAKEAEGVHGISTLDCHNHGYDLKSILDGLVSMIHRADVIVAHNAMFDWSVLFAELTRLEMDMTGLSKPVRCTMRQGAPICQIPGRRPGEYKWPKLSELYGFLFHRQLEGAHSALADARACLDCYVEMQKLEGQSGNSGSLTA